MRAVRNLVAPPIVIITDSKEFAFNFPTRYRVDVSNLRHFVLPTKFYGFSSRQGRIWKNSKIKRRKWKLMEARAEIRLLNDTNCFRWGRVEAAILIFLFSILRSEFNRLRFLCFMPSFSDDKKFLTTGAHKIIFRWINVFRRSRGKLSRSDTKAHF